jgi:hypothetical protein
VERVFETCPRVADLGRTCKRRSCRICGQRWARNVYVVLSRNLDCVGAVVMVTLTAPGEDVLPWDRELCTHGPGVDCAGKRGCKVQARALREWAGGGPAYVTDDGVEYGRGGDVAQWRWKQAHDVARKAAPDARLLARVWEPQRRGVPHLHVILAAGRPCDRIAANAYARALVAAAPRYGWGPQHRIGKPQSGADAARYLASYLTGRNSRKASIRENIADRRLPSSLVYVSADLTRITGVTMRRLRLVRWFRAATRGRCGYPVVREVRARNRAGRIKVLRTEEQEIELVARAYMLTYAGASP